MTLVQILSSKAGEGQSILWKEQCHPQDQSSKRHLAFKAQKCKFRYSGINNWSATNREHLIRRQEKQGRAWECCGTLWALAGGKDTFQRKDNCDVMNLKWIYDDTDWFFCPPQMKRFGDTQQTSCPPWVSRWGGFRRKRSPDPATDPVFNHQRWEFKISATASGLSSAGPLSCTWYFHGWWNCCRMYPATWAMLWMGGKIPPLPPARALKQELSLPPFSPWVTGLPVLFAVVKLSNSSLKPKPCCLSQSPSCSCKFLCSGHSSCRSNPCQETLWKLWD